MSSNFVGLSVIMFFALCVYFLGDMMGSFGVQTLAIFIIVGVFAYGFNALLSLAGNNEGIV